MQAGPREVCAPNSGWPGQIPESPEVTGSCTVDPQQRGVVPDAVIHGPVKHEPSSPTLPGWWVFVTILKMFLLLDVEESDVESAKRNSSICSYQFLCIPTRPYSVVK